MFTRRGLPELLAALALVAALVPRHPIRNYSLCGVVPGMTCAQTIDTLGPPRQTGPLAGGGLYAEYPTVSVSFGPEDRARTGIGDAAKGPYGWVHVGQPQEFIEAALGRPDHRSPDAFSYDCPGGYLQLTVRHGRISCIQMYAR